MIKNVTDPDSEMKNQIWLRPTLGFGSVQRWDLASSNVGIWLRRERVNISFFDSLEYFLYIGILYVSKKSNMKLDRIKEIVKQRQENK